MMEQTKPISETGFVTEQPVVKQGEVQFMSKGAFKNAAPKILLVSLNAIIYFCAGMGTLIGATDLFSGRQSKIMMFIFGVISLACGAIKFSFGVVDTSKN